MITIEQIRAARGLLDWSQERLAVEAGLSLRALNNLERGAVIPRIDTLTAIQQAFEKANIEFLENNGVRLKAERLDLEKFEGASCIERLTNDFCETYKSGGGEVLMSGLDERKFLPFDDEIYNYHNRQLEKFGIINRILTRKGDNMILDPPPCYRWLEPNVFGEVPYMVYGDNLALIIWEPILRMAIIRNAAIASTFRRQFEVNWANAETPPFVKLYENWPEKSGPWTVAKARAFMAYVEKKKPRAA